MRIKTAAQGTAYVHNLICGTTRGYNVTDRATPYHYPHTTDVAGYAFVYGGDDRVINNIIIGSVEGNEKLEYFGKALDGYSVPEEYMPEIEKLTIRRDHGKFFKVPQPVWIEENAYSGYANPFRAEIDPILTDGMSASVEEKNCEWVLTLTVPECVSNANCREVNTKRLGTPRITEERYEDPNGNEIDLLEDMVGKRREGHIIPGALTDIKPGINRITVWSNK